jgi:hypothetical protein
MEIKLNDPTPTDAITCFYLQIEQVYGDLPFDLKQGGTHGQDSKSQHGCGRRPGS